MYIDPNIHSLFQALAAVFVSGVLLVFFRENTRLYIAASPKGAQG